MSFPTYFSRPCWGSGCLLVWGHLAQGQALTTHLATVDKCGQYTTATVCVSTPRYEQLPSPPYRNLTISLGDTSALGDGAPPARAASARKRKQHQAESVLLLSFDYHVKGTKLFYFSSLVGPITHIPPACRGQDELLFCLTDTLHTRRSVAKACDTFTSQLLRKEVRGRDTLYTYSIARVGSTDAPTLRGLVFDQHFQVKSLAFDTRGFVVLPRKHACEPDSILYFK